MNRSLHLASASPRRQEILAALRLEFTAKGVNIDESIVPGETPRDMVLRLSVAKAAAAPQIADQVVLGSDTAVVLGDTVMGKPADADDAIRMLMALSGQSHHVLTAVALRTDSGTATACSDTQVSFREIGRDEARRYWQSGEPQDKAGGYGIQGLGGAFVRAIRGSYSGVVGLPVFETVELLRAAGIEVLVKQDD